MVFHVPPMAAPTGERYADHRWSVVHGDIYKWHVWVRARPEHGGGQHAAFLPPAQCSAGGYGRARRGLGTDGSLRKSKCQRFSIIVAPTISISSRLPQTRLCADPFVSVWGPCHLPQDTAGSQGCSQGRPHNGFQVARNQVCATNSFWGTRQYITMPVVHAHSTGLRPQPVSGGKPVGFPVARRPESALRQVGQLTPSGSRPRRLGSSGFPGRRTLRFNLTLSCPVAAQVPARHVPPPSQRPETTFY